MTVRASDMASWSIRWGNPHTQSPCGRTVKASVLVRRGEPCPAEILEQKMPGDGWAICWQLVTQRPVRRWSQEAKSRTRRRNLRQRLERKVPLFADMFEAEELAARPSYYAAEDPTP